MPTSDCGGGVSVMKLFLLSVIFFVCESHVQAAAFISSSSRISTSTYGRSSSTYGNAFTHSVGGTSLNFVGGSSTGSVGGTAFNFGGGSSSSTASVGGTTFNFGGGYSTGGTAKILGDAKKLIDDATVSWTDKFKARSAARKCLYTNKMNDDVLKKLEDHPEYVSELADINLAKVRKYYSTTSTDGKRIYGRQLRDLFWHLVYPEMSAVIPEDSDFPVASDTNPKNKETAVNFLRKACEETGTEILDWDKVEQNICSGPDNWKPSTNDNTVHDIFVASLIEYYTQKVLAHPDGLQRISNAANVEQLKKRWDRVSELLTGKHSTFKSILPELCVDDDLPDDPAQRKVFAKLSKMALNIEQLGEPACPILEEDTPELAMMTFNTDYFDTEKAPDELPEETDTGAPEEIFTNIDPDAPNMPMD